MIDHSELIDINCDACNFRLTGEENELFSDYNLSICRECFAVMVYHEQFPKWAKRWVDKPRFYTKRK